MKIEAIPTRKLTPPQDNLYEVLGEALPTLSERSIVVVTSKVVAIHQGRCIPLVEGGIDRDELAYKEADLLVPKDIVPGEYILFTIKNQTLIASAGIDKSNASDHMVLWPNKLGETALEIHRFLKEKHKLTELGVIITDSHVVMMRRGTMGISLSHFGFNPIRDYRGTPDIFGRHLQVQVANVVDALAAAAVLTMGEGKEQTPLAIISELEGVEFSEDLKVNQGDPELMIPMEEDLFGPMIQAVPWQKGQGGITDEELAGYKEKPTGKK